MLLTQEQEMIRDTMRAFAQERLAPFAAEWDKNHTFPAQALKELGELGALGMVVPEEWDGAGMDYMSLVLLDTNHTSPIKGDQTDWLANNFFSNAAGQPVADQPFRNWAGSLGGPIRIPKIYDGRNRTFFFFSYDRTHTIDPRTGSTRSRVTSGSARRATASGRSTSAQCSSSTSKGCASGCCDRSDGPCRNRSRHCGSD